MYDQAWWHTPIISALGSQEDHEFEDSPGFMSQNNKFFKNI
jgi:hypothetical protein